MHSRRAHTRQALEIARQLTLIEFQLYRRIAASELLGQAWLKTNREAASPNLLALVRRFNLVSLWVSTELLRSSLNTKQRAAIAKHFIAIGHHFKKLNNFNGVCFCSMQLFFLLRELSFIITQQTIGDGDCCRPGAGRHHSSDRYVG